MKLSAEQVSLVINHLKKFRTPQCVMCGHDDWKVSVDVFALPQYVSPFASSPMSSVPEVFPVVPVVCSTCGNVLLLSAVAVGVAR
jgi:hypothetical protein